MEMTQMKQNLKNDSLEEILARGIPAERQDLVKTMYPVVIKNTSGRIWSKCGLGEAESLDLAVAAALYALRSYVNGNRPWPQTPEDWTNQAVWKGTMLARDIFKRMKQMPTLSLEREEVSEEGEVQGDSPALKKASVQAWRDREAEEERRLRCAAVRYALPKVVQAMRTKNELRTLKIVKAAYLAELPVPEICQRYEGLNRNGLYQILFRFRDCFAEVGPHYMDEFLDLYADTVREAA